MTRERELGFAKSGRGEGDALSAEAVKARIKALVDSEEPNKILSDDRIVEILIGQGVDIARRTVAKYLSLIHI